MALAATGDGTLITMWPDAPLDGELVDSLRLTADGALNEGKTRFLLNLQKVSHADSAGLEGLVKMARNLGANGARLALVGPNPLMRDILRATRLDRRFAVFDSTEQALQSMRAEV